MLLPAVVIVVMVLAHFVFSEEPPGPDVITLTNDNFDPLVLNSDPRHRQPWLVEFYAPWCSHCRKFASQYIEVGKRLKGRVHVGHVDVAANKALGRRFGVKGFPSFKIFGPNKSVPVQYQGPRTVEALVSKVLALADQWQSEEMVKEKKLQD